MNEETIEKIKNKRIVVLNDEIFALSESNYRKAMGKSDMVLIPEKRYEDDHQKRCERVRKYGRKILDADRIMRND